MRLSDTNDCYLNGQFVPLAGARISVLDRGFIFGDGVYELIPVFSRRPFRLLQHLDRFERSLRAIRIPEPLSREKWCDLISELVRRNDSPDQTVYLQVTRGVAERNHALPRDASPTVFAMSTRAAPETNPTPASAIIVDDVRWLRCDIKSTSLLANVLLRDDASTAGAYEALLTRDGQVLEGAASNVFVVVRGGTIKTPPKSHLLLPGVTRDLLIELLRDSATPVVETALPLAEVRAAEEIWLTSSSRGVVPVTRLDGQPVGEGQADQIYERVRALYERYKASLGPGHP